MLPAPSRPQGQALGFKSLAPPCLVPTAGLVSWAQPVRSHRTPRSQDLPFGLKLCCFILKSLIHVSLNWCLLSPTGMMGQEGEQKWCLQCVSTCCPSVSHLHSSCPVNTEFQRPPRCLGVQGSPEQVQRKFPSITESAGALTAREARSLSKDWLQMGEGGSGALGKHNQPAEPVTSFLGQGPSLRD